MFTSTTAQPTTLLTDQKHRRNIKLVHANAYLSHNSKHNAKEFMYTLVIYVDAKLAQKIKKQGHENMQEIIFIPSAMLDPRLVVCSREKTKNPKGEYRESTEILARGFRTEAKP